MFKKPFVLLLLVLVFAHFATVYGQTPPNLTSDIQWDENASTAGNQQTYANKTAVENAFNNARRQEETQKSLTANALGTLSLPSTWTSLTDDQKALILLNYERRARVGVNYGSGALTGLPFEGVEGNLDGVTQGHANWCITNNKWQHNGPGATDQLSNRINAVPAIANCYQTWGENIAIFASSSTSQIPLLLERSIYTYIYADLSSAWGHRQNCLKQGFTNDRGLANTEGFIGWGSGGKTDGTYNPIGFNLVNQQMTIMDYFDPKNTCTYSITVIPLELLVFDAKPTKNGIELSWTTVSEVNFEGFTVERSQDGVYFTPLDFIAAKGKTASDKTNYSFTDPSVKPHLVYFYRLQMQDFGGKTNKSPIRAAILRGSIFGVADYRLTPNVAQNELTVENLSYETRSWTVEVFDLAGRAVLSEKLQLDGGAAQRLRLSSSVSSAFYIIRIGEGATFSTEKIAFIR